MTIAEFCVIFNPYLERFLLITGRPCPTEDGGGVWYYTAEKLTGPWSEEKLLLANSEDGGLKWSYYGTYTIDEAASTVTHHVQGCLSPAWVGGDRTRRFELLDNDRLSLSATMADDSNVPGEHVLIWRRVR